jgi:hypothetical protein
MSIWKCIISQVIWFTIIQRRYCKCLQKVFVRDWPPTQSETRTWLLGLRSLISTLPVACAARCCNATSRLSCTPWAGILDTSFGKKSLAHHGKSNLKPTRQPAFTNLVKIRLYWIWCKGGAIEQVRRTESHSQTDRHISKIKEQHQQRRRPVFISKWQGATK